MKAATIREKSRWCFHKLVLRLPCRYGHGFHDMPGDAYKGSQHGG